jgi:hypothetical protein
MRQWESLKTFPALAPCDVYMLAIHPFFPGDALSCGEKFLSRRLRTEIPSGYSYLCRLGQTRHEEFQRMKWRMLAVAWVLPLCLGYSAHAQTSGVSVFPINGTPLLLSGEAPPLLLKEPQAIRPGDQIHTGPQDRILIHLTNESGCRFLLEPNGVIALNVSRDRRFFQAKIDQGTLQSPTLKCRVPVRIQTPAARIEGEKSSYRVRVSPRATTVELSAGKLKAYFNGQAIPLRPMTRTTFSRSGRHRIATIQQRDAAGALSVLSLALPVQGKRGPANAYSPASKPRGR